MDIENTKVQIVAASAILGALVETCDSPLSDAIYGVKDYLDRIVDDIEVIAEKGGAQNAGNRKT